MVERRRKATLNVRVTEDEAEMLKTLAERQGLSASDVVRQFIRNAYEALFPPKKKR